MKVHDSCANLPPRNMGMCNDASFSFVVEIIQGFGWTEIYSPEVVEKVIKLSIDIFDFV